MIVVFYGQPHSGKTTLAQAYQTRLFIETGKHVPIVDGDEIRQIFVNKDFSNEGRLKNLQKISDIATFLERQYGDVIVSAVYPLKEARKYLNDLNANNVVWIFLRYDTPRGRESYHVKDFQAYYDGYDSINTSNINTDFVTIPDCIDLVRKIVNKLK
jgi:adenylylsulfate kinase-like enzyme